MSLLNYMEQETVAEVGNISLGAAASALSSILNRRVTITAPRVQILTASEIKKGFPVPCLLVEVSYRSGLQGDNILLMKQEDARAIAGIMMGTTGTPSLGEMELSAIQEAMNQMTGYMATSMSEMFGQTIAITPPKLTKCVLADHDFNHLPDESLAVQVSFSIQIEGVIDSKLVQVIPVEFARQMAAFLLSGGETALGADPLPEEGEPPLPPPAEQPEEAAPPTYAERPDMASLPVVGEQPDGLDWRKLALVREIPLEVKVILGRTRIPLGNLFALDQGAIISLDQVAGEPVEILVNDKLVATGEIVMINEQFGVKITRQLTGH